MFMDILVLYATYSGGTQMASQIVKEEIEKSGNQVKYLEVKDADWDVILKYKLVILCTPTWDFNGKEGQPHEDFMKLIDKSTSVSLKDINFAVLSLGDSSYTKFCGSADVLTDFIKEKGGNQIINPLKIDGFFFNQETHTESIRKWTGEIVSNKS